MATSTAANLTSNFRTVDALVHVINCRFSKPNSKFLSVQMKWKFDQFSSVEFCKKKALLFDSLNFQSVIVASGDSETFSIEVDAQCKCF